MQIVFYDGDLFPEEYRGDAFVAMRGSWNRRPPSGSRSCAYHSTAAAYLGRSCPCVGFLSDDGSQTFARPVGLAVAADGALLIADEANGVIYRVSTTRATQRAALGR